MLPMRRWLVLAVCAALASPMAIAAPAPAAAVEFDPSFFPSGAAQHLDLSRFSRADVNQPGDYSGNVTVNGLWRERGSIRLAQGPGHDAAQPCFNRDRVALWGVDLGKLEADTGVGASSRLTAEDTCAPIGDFIPGATMVFDAGEQALDVQIPQIYMSRDARGYVPPSQWDAGINAARLDYSANTYRSVYAGRASTSGYLGLDGSMNLGAWHLRHQGNLNWNSQRGRDYTSTATFLQHDVPELRAQFIVGDTFTDGTVLESVRMRGLRVFSDDTMLPQSQRGYAPVVRGVAETNAHVVVRQNGYVIYDTSVAPGPFVIDDLFPTGYGGDLVVDVTEADGRLRQFTVPFAAVPLLLRPGQNRWSLASGRVQELDLKSQPFFLQGTWQRGLTNRWTLYGGGTVANGYRAFTGGAALATGAGAFSLDMTHARNQAPDQSATQGHSVRLGYNKNFLDSGTNLAMAAFRYNTEGFVSWRDAVTLRDRAARGGEDTLLIGRERNRFDLTVNQDLGIGWGQLYLNGSARDFYGRSGRTVDFSAGYSNRWGIATYGFSAQRTRDTGGRRLLPNGLPLIDGRFDDVFDSRRDTRYMFTFSLPLGNAVSAPLLSSSVTQDSTGRSVQANLNGTAGAERQWNYGASASHQGSQNQVFLNSGYRGSKGSFTGGAGWGNGYNQQNAGGQGTVLVHGGGVTFGAVGGQSMGLIHAPGAAGAGIQGVPGAQVDARGYAIVPYLQPYQLNTVTLDPRGADAGLEVDSTTIHVAPRLGSVVKLDFDARGGHAVLVQMDTADGAPLPFGADIYDAQGSVVGVVGQASQLFIRNLPESGVVTVKWSGESPRSCQVDVALPAHAPPSGMTTVAGHCRAADPATSAKERAP
jgi:outer membrane usher protein